MQRRGIEYLEDGLIAAQIDREEREALAQYTQKKHLQEQASELLIKLLAAEDNPSPDAIEIAELKHELQNVNLLLLKEEKTTTTAKIMNLTTKEQKTTLPEKAAPKRIFNEAEMQLINDHYKKLPEELRKLIDVSINDDRISLDLIPNPVFIRSEGQVYDNATVIELLKNKHEAHAPYNPDVIFKRSDIIPCNTLIIAMEYLLDIIKGKIIKPEPREYKISSLTKIGLRRRIPAELVTFVEHHYKKMEDKHKLLFDAICRDPITKEIMDDPVFLPDGYIYDRSTALAYLGIKQGVCPSNSLISFKQEDITPCYFVISVLEQLKQNINEKIKWAKEHPEPSPGVKNSI